MSEAIVQVLPIEKISPHPDPETENLLIAEIGGWQCVYNKNNGYREGQNVLFIPPDCLLPNELADSWGVSTYLSESKNNFGYLRTRAIRLRGEPSYGLTLSVPGDLEWEYGQNFAEHFGIKKYEPPINGNVSDAEKQDPLFVQYTNIENLRNFNRVLENGEDVTISEKLHGSSGRVGVIDGVIMAGSHRLRRREPVDGDYARNIYWSPYSIPGVKALIDNWQLFGLKQAILFGEIIGSPVQKLDYGYQNKLGFRAFDILMDGKYLDYDEFRSLCNSFSIETVPELYRGSYSMDVVKELSSGNTTLGADHMREGVVVRPTIERWDHAVGRVILKYLSDEYLTSKSMQKADKTDI